MWRPGDGARHIETYWVNEYVDAALGRLRWHLQQGRSAIPKSTKPAHIAENFDIFDFQLTNEQLTAIDALDTGKRGGPEPDAITLATFGRPIPED